MRCLQGLGAAIVLPAALSIVMNMFPEGAERNKALGVWGAIGASGATVGVMAGGLLTRYAGWQYIFYLNVPIGAAALAARPARRAGEPARHEHAGAMTRSARSTVTGGLSLLVYAISTAPQVGWGTARTVSLLAVSVALLAAFVVIETRVEAPLMPLRIFRLQDAGGRERGRRAARRQLLRVHLHRHPVHAAGARVLRAEGRSRLAGGDAHLGRLRRPVAGAGHPRLGQARDGGRHGHDRRRHPVGDPGARARALLGRAWPGRSSIVGVGTAFAFIPVSIAALAGVAEHEAGLASGLINTSQQLGGAIGVAVASTIAATHASTLLHQGADTSRGAHRRLPVGVLGLRRRSAWPRSRSRSCWSAATS